MHAYLYSHGAVEEVTGSKHFLEANGATIMVDCGAFQGVRQEAYAKNSQWNFDASKISALALTHAHYDHSGLIPLLPRKGFTGSIYTASASRELAYLVMMDSAKIQRADMEYLTRRAEKDNTIFEGKPLYNEKDVIEVINRFITVGYRRPILLPGGILAEFFDAGHILGAAGIRFELSDGVEKRHVYFSGDIGPSNKPILRDPDVPPPCDYVVMESTYGDRLHDANHEDVLTTLAKIINETVAAGGKIIIPAFAIDRTQDVIYHLHRLNLQRRIPPLPIFVDSPMAVNATAIYRAHPECFDEALIKDFDKLGNDPFGFNGLRYVQNVEDSKKINDLKEPCIILSASGMCENGRIVHHLKNNVENPKNTILLVGYMAEHTLGRAIREHKSPVRIFGKPYEVRARIEKIDMLSGHADYAGLWNFVEKMDVKRIRTLFLVHGEPKSQSVLREFLLDKGVGDVRIVKRGEKYELN